MKRVIKITEQDLHRLVKRVLEEQSLLNEGYSQLVHDVQQKLKNTKYGFYLGTSGPNGDGVDGDFGTRTKLVLQQFQKDNNLLPTGQIDFITKVVLGLGAKYPDKAIVKSNETANKTQPKTQPKTGFVIPFAFPTYEPKCDGTGFWAKFICKAAGLVTGASKSGTYGKLGHGGVATVEPDGNTRIFEFGRYSGSKNGYGIVIPKNLGKIAKISDGKISNIQNLLTAIKSKTEGEGPRMPMEYVELSAPTIVNGIQYAQSVKEKKYSAIDFSIGDEDANCGTFAIEVVNASGVGQGKFCATTPKGMIRGFENSKGAISKGTV